MGLNLGFIEVMIEGDALTIVKVLYVNHDDRSVISCLHYRFKIFGCKL